MQDFSFLFDPNRYGKIKSTGEVKQIIAIHARGIAIGGDFAEFYYDLNSYGIDEWEPASEEDYINCIRLKKFKAYNEKRLLENKPPYTMKEIDEKFPTKAPGKNMR